MEGAIEKDRDRERGGNERNREREVYIKKGKIEQDRKLHKS